MGEFPGGPAATAAAAIQVFPPLGARRLLMGGGISLILAGMIFGDIFAVFALHQNADSVARELMAATEAVAAGDREAVQLHFAAIGKLLENRGTKVDAHAHLIAFGYLSLLLALLQPYVALSPSRKKHLAVLFLLGATLLPVAVYLIYHVGLAYSPLRTIGWASLGADFGGLLVILACAGELGGLWRYLRSEREGVRAEELLPHRSWSSRALLLGGTLLVLAGFVHGLYYAATDREGHEIRDVALQREMVENAVVNLPAARQNAKDYGWLQAHKAVKIAAHTHVIEFGVLALLLAFVQPFIFLSERWKRRWVVTLLAGSVILPVFVLLELRWGLVAGGIADVGGLLVILALTGMLVGVIRYTKKLDTVGN